MNATELIAILALTGYAIYRQTRVSEVTGRARFKLAIIYAGVGLLLGVHVGSSSAAIGLLALSLLASLIVGLVRGRLTAVWAEPDGRTFTQGTKLTVGLFLGLVAFKFGLGTVAYLTHTSYESGIGEILLMIGAMLAVQAEITWRRAQALRSTPAPAALVTI